MSAIKQEVSKDTKRSRLVRRAAWGGLGFLLLLVFVRIIFNPSYYSPAATPRPHIHEFKLAMEPDTTPVTSFKVSSPTFNIITTGQHVHLKRVNHGTNETRQKPSLAFHFSQAEVPIKFPGVFVKLNRIGVACSTAADSAQASAVRRLPATFFTPGLKPMDENTLAAELPRPSDRQLPAILEFPVVSFDLSIKAASPQIVDLKLFDARTGVSIGLPDATKLSSGEFRITAQPRLWHATPVLLVIDIATDPYVETIKLQPGETFDFGDLLGQVVFVDDNAKPRMTMHGMGEAAFTLHPAINESFVLLNMSDRSGPNSYNITYRDATGRRFPLALESRFDELRLYSIPRGVDSQDLLEIDRPSKRHRVILQFPKLPGLPAVNDSVENLFAVKVPYARFESPSEHMTFILDATQLRRNEYHPQVPSGLSGYPREYINATPAQMLQDYADLLPEYGIFTVDERALHMRWIRPDPHQMLKEFWERLTGP